MHTIPPKPAKLMQFEFLKKNSRFIATSLVCILTILTCVLPMSLNPIWNGEIPQARNQYEVMAASILQGKIELDVSVDEKLLEMENPYDPDAREAAGVDFHWDHAFYNGHYYMYFGIIPALLVFTPYLAITGQSLTTYHATQLFVALFIIGLFALFWKLYSRYFKRIPFWIFLLLCASFSIMSVWWSIGGPALYCTAISAGLCAGIWSLYLYYQALDNFDIEGSNKYRGYLFFGAILGAMTFGCRPPVGLFGVIVFPILIRLFKQKRSLTDFLLDLLCILAPYLLIGTSLMIYNYLRFESVFEFGQSYQLTRADQQNYAKNNENLIELPKRMIEYLFAIGNLSEAQFSGIYINFPILLFSFFGIASKKTRRKLKEINAVPFLVAIAISILLIAAIDSLWSPFILERYRMDAYWLAAIISFVLLCTWSSAINSPILNIAIVLFSILTIWLLLLYAFTPFDFNLGTLYPDLSVAIRSILSFGILQ